MRSDGCPTIGDQAETLGTKAIVDWLNGRARAWNDAGEPVRADWTTGDVGMTGVSYNGTLPNMVATTGVEGLKTIVPVSAIASWYDYYRANGLVVAPHSEPSGVGDNAFQGEDMDVLAYFTEGDARLEHCRHVTDRLAQFQANVDLDGPAVHHGPGTASGPGDCSCHRRLGRESQRCSASTDVHLLGCRDPRRVGAWHHLRAVALPTTTGAITELAMPPWSCFLPGRAS